MNLSEFLSSLTTDKVVDTSEQPVFPYNTVHADDWEPVTVIDPQPEGPWICGGAALSWYTGRPVRESDIDVFCADKLQASELASWLTEKGASRLHFSENAATYHYNSRVSGCNHFWKIQIIQRDYFTSIEDVIDHFDISVTMIGTDGNQFFFNEDAISDISTKTLRMTLPIRAGAVKRYCKYVAYGYRPVPGLHAQIFGNPDTSWEFDPSEDYDGV